MDELTHQTASRIRRVFSDHAHEWRLLPERRERIEEHLGQAKLGL